MIVYVDRDSELSYCLVKVGKDSHDWKKDMRIDIPDELMSRYEKANDEYGEVQELLKKLYEESIT